MKDLNNIASIAHPAANASAVTAALDLGSVKPGPMVTLIEARIYSEAVPSLADTKKATLTIQDSADGTNFTAIAALATLVQTGASSAGAAAAERKILLPKTVRRYIRVQSTVEASGGDNTAKKFGIELLF